MFTSFAFVSHKILSLGSLIVCFSRWTVSSFWLFRRGQVALDELALKLSLSESSGLSREIDTNELRELLRWFATTSLPWAPSLGSQLARVWTSRSMSSVVSFASLLFLWFSLPLTCFLICVSVDENHRWREASVAVILVFGSCQWAAFQIEDHFCRSTAIKMKKETFWRRPLISSLQWGEMVFQGGETRSGVKWVILAEQSWTNKQVGEKKWTEWGFPGFKVFLGGLWLSCSIIQL